MISGSQSLGRLLGHFLFCLIEVKRIIWEGFRSLGYLIGVLTIQ